MLDRGLPQQLDAGALSLVVTKKHSTTTGALAACHHHCLCWISYVHTSRKTPPLQKHCQKGGALDKDLHATAQAQHQVQGGLLLDVVVRQGAAILQLLAGKDQALLVRGDALLVLDLALHILNGVRDSTSSVMVLPVRVLHKDLQCYVSRLHTRPRQAATMSQSHRAATSTRHMHHCINSNSNPRSAAWFMRELLILIALQQVASSQKLDVPEGRTQDLHASTQAQHQVQGGLLLDVVVSQGAAVLQLLASKDQALLVRGDALLQILDLVFTFSILSDDSKPPA